MSGIKPSELVGYKFYIVVCERDLSALHALRENTEGSTTTCFDRGPFIPEVYLKNATIENAAKNTAGPHRCGEVMIAEVRILSEAEVSALNPNNSDFEFVNQKESTNE